MRTRVRVCCRAWPSLTIELKAHPRFYSLEWSAFPKSFVADVEAFLADAGSRDEFADDYAKAVSPGTIELRRRQLRQLATVCVESCVAPERLTDLPVLVERETGLKVHVHLAGKLYLAAHPEGIEAVRQILQHSNSATTSRYYIEHRISDAFAR